MLWERRGRLREDVDEIVLVDLSLLSSDVGPLWSRRSEGTSVSIGGFGREWNRRESEEKALCEELLRNFCEYRLSTRMWPSISLYLLGSDVGPLWSQGLEGISVSIGGLRCDCGRRD